MEMEHPDNDLTTLKQLTKLAAHEAAATRVKDNPREVPADAYHEPLERYISAMLEAYGSVVDAYATAINEAKASFQRAIKEVGSERNLPPDRIQEMLTKEEARFTTLFAQRLHSVREEAAKRLSPLGITDSTVASLINTLVQEKIRKNNLNQ